MWFCDRNLVCKHHCGATAHYGHAMPAMSTTTKPPTPPPTTVQPTTVESVEGCTEDGSNVLGDEIIVENLYDLSVLADDGSGKLVLQVTQRCW